MRRIRKRAIRKPPARLWRLVAGGVAIVLLAVLLRSAWQRVSSSGAWSSPGETWEVIYDQRADDGGQKIGYLHTRTSREVEAGRTLRRVELTLQLDVQRFGDVSTPSVQVTSWETLEGKLVRFESHVHMSREPTIRRGRVEGQQLIIEEAALGRTTRRSIPWDGQALGPAGLYDVLRASPPRPGQARAVRTLDATLGQVVETSLIAEEFEETRLLEGTQKLLRCQGRTPLPGGIVQQETLWLADDGTPKKRRLALGGEVVQEIYLTTRDIALAPSAARLDIGKRTTVAVNRPVSHQSRLAKYVVQMQSENPAELFASDETQHVKPLSARRAEITVAAVDPGGASTPRFPEPAEEFRRSSALVQSDDAEVLKLSQSVAQDEKNAWRVGIALEKLVRDTVREKNFSTALASAGEVARTRAGDCTEHAVLLTALLRARGIPARVAVGLVYSPAAGGFAFHMWTEGYFEGGWIPLDATLGQGGVGAAHIKMFDTPLAGDAATASASLLPVIRALGQLQIEVLEVQ